MLKNDGGDEMDMWMYYTLVGLFAVTWFIMLIGFGLLLQKISAD